MTLATYFRIMKLGKIVVLVVLLLAAFGMQHCTERVAASMSSAAPAPRPRPVAVLPVAYLMPISSRKWVPLADTGRAGGPAHLLRKASPRSRWLPAQPAYLHLHRRPPQHLLDSLARESMRRA